MRHQIFGIPIDDCPKKRLLQIIEGWFNSVKTRIIVTPNAEIILEAKKDKSFREKLYHADLSVPDGVALRFAVAALTTNRLENRMTGVDLLHDLSRLCLKHNKRLLLFGGDLHAAEQSAKRLSNVYPGLDVVSLDPGYLEYRNGAVLIPDPLYEQIRTINPDVLAVALGQKKQEAFMEQLRTMGIQGKIMVGVGGALEMVSGQKRRGPYWMRRSGLEWLWRLWIEPVRVKRIFRATIVFPAVVICEVIHQQHLFSACKKVIPEIYRQLRGL